MTVRELVDNVGLEPDTPILDAMPSLSPRLYNALRRGRVATLADLARCDDNDLLDIRNFGVGMLGELKRELEGIGRACQANPEAIQGGGAL